MASRSELLLDKNALTLAIEARQAASLPTLDLTVSNPTTAGLPYDRAAITQALSDPRALVYEPLPFGLPSAREAVARELEVIRPVDPARVLLTASSSEAYAFLFKLLCDPGDDVAIAAPSYPLFEHLAQLEGVAVRPYRLAYDGAWHVDLDSLKRAIGPKTRAIVVVHPNNPTGSFLSKAELAAMAETGLPIISDEVFVNYTLSEDPSRAQTAREAEDTLVFALGGLSKAAGLPQMKLGWTAVGGPKKRVDEALARLEIIADTFLSVGTPVQHALPTLLTAGHAVSEAIRARTRANLAVVDAAIDHRSPITRLRVDGGWYATLRLPRTKSEEQWVLELLAEGVLVHPGAFFDFESEAYVVVSLLTPEATLAEGAARLVAHVARG